MANAVLVTTTKNKASSKPETKDTTTKAATRPRQGHTRRRTRDQYLVEVDSSNCLMVMSAG